MCKTPPDPKAVHCPHCRVEPGQQCRTPSGATATNGAWRACPSRVRHPASRVRFQSGRRRAVQTPRPGCRSQPDLVRGVSRSDPMVATLGPQARLEPREAYEREHGPDESIKALPPGTTVEQAAGMSVSELMAQMERLSDKVTVERPKRQ